MWWLKNQTNSIGLIAGQGELPLLFAKAANALKKRVIVFGAEGYTDKRVESLAAETHYVPLGGLGKLVELLKKTSTKQVVLAGAIPKKEIYNPKFKADGMTESFIGQTRLKGDDHILKAFEVFLKVQCGVSIMDSRFLLKDALCPKGVLTQRIPTKAEWEDLRFGQRMAKGIGRLDIGQTVVVKNGVVLAVEALEGTDQAIRRGADLGKGTAVVVKLSKPNQALRFDLPCVGLETLESLKSSGSFVLGMEAGKTIMISKEAILESANKNQITLVGL